jgi:uncharacterized protein
MHRAVIRRVKAALLYELSIVTRPAYPEAQVEARSWDLSPKSPPRHLGRSLARWRA